MDTQQLKEDLKGFLTINILTLFACLVSFLVILMYNHKLEKSLDENAINLEEIAYYQEELMEFETFIEYAEMINALNKVLIEDGRYISPFDGQIYYIDRERFNIDDGFTKDTFLDMYDFMDELIEVVMLYYETTDQSVDIDVWVQENYPELYAQYEYYDELRWD